MVITWLCIYYVMALEHLIQAELHHWLYYCIPDSDKTQSYALQTLQLGENVSVTLKLHYIQYIGVCVCVCVCVP